jgi:hypothetical protein
MEIPLLSGAYSSQSYISSAQRSINVYPEKNPDNIKAPAPFTHYARPGLLALGNGPPAPGPGRCLYRTTKGDLYAVVAQAVYYIDPNWTWTLIGNLLTAATTPVSIADNGVNALIVDNSPFGYSINLATRAFIQVADPNFLGGTRADFIDSFIILNNPGTNQWYCTQSNSLTFNALYIGVKTAWPDNIFSLVAIEREVWLFGPQKSEPWFNAGQIPFPFQILPGVIIEQGCVAPYSPAKMDTNVYWLSESPEGARMVMRGNAQNVAVRISTHAIEAEFLTYPRVDDAIGAVYQIAGHSFYKLHFPTADKTWGFDEATQQWHEDNWIDTNGQLHRARNTFCAYAYGLNLALDWATGTLYEISSTTTTDNGNPIPWIRSFPHVINELKRTGMAAITADVACTNELNTGDTTQFLSPWSQGFNAGFGPLMEVPAPMINLRISRDGGNEYGNYRSKLIPTGKFRTMRRWRGNGEARDWVFELSSTAQMCPAMNGIYIDPIEGSS